MKILLGFLVLQIVLSTVCAQESSAVPEEVAEVAESTTQTPQGDDGADQTFLEEAADALDGVLNNDQEQSDTEDPYSEDALNVLINGKPIDPDARNITARTFLGAITGKQVEHEDGTVINTFLGIPYAQPPVGELRFMPPVPVNSYDNLEAFGFGPMCIQYDEGFEVDTDEDCLSLNVYAKETNDTKLRPVMVFIHGGGFYGGSGKTYDPTPLVKEDVVGVTINYRLGALGFLTFGNDIMPGNNGLRDQIQALKWVHNMIQYFGGDPHRVTIFGESAGAMSAHALQMSPKAYGLFQGAIYESGTMFMLREDWKRSKRERIAQNLAQYFNCTHSDYGVQMLQCLQEIPADELLAATAGVETPVPAVPNTAGWIPYVDAFSRDPVLPMDYLEAMKNGYFSRTPIMTGTVLNDGAVWIPEIDYKEKYEAEGAIYLSIFSSQNKTEITEMEEMQSNIAKQYYIGDGWNLLDHLPKWVDMMNDALFLSPDQKVAELASQYVPVYNFRFNFKGTQSYLPFYILGREEQFEGVDLDSLLPVHADETNYLFDIFDLSTDEELEMRRVMVKYWTNFAKYGHPSPLLSDNLTQWLPFSSEKRYMVLDKETYMDSHVEKQRMTFWDLIHFNERMNELEEVSIFQRALATMHSYLSGQFTYI